MKKKTGKIQIHMILPIFLVIPFAAVDVWMYTQNMTSGVAGTVFTAVYLVLVLALYLRSRRVLLQELVNYAVEYGSVQKHLLEELEIPYALLAPDGKVLWSNKSFAEYSGRGKDYHKSVTTIFPQITREMLSKTERETDIEFGEEGIIFRAALRKIIVPIGYERGIPEMSGDEMEGQSLWCLYLFDVTRLHRALTENEEIRMVPALIYIDNYDETLEGMEEVKRALLSALADQKVNKFFAGIDGLVRKTENDKYFAVFQHKHLKVMQEGRVSLLDEIKNAKIGNEISLTLSIGIGFVENDYKKSYEYAKKAVELALGRGGDQAVLKTQESVSYYGGNRQQLEKNTRVKARVKALALREIINSGDRFLIMGHAIADVDSFGAAIGVYCAARQLGKKAQIVIDEVNSTLRPLKEGFSEENGYPDDLFISSREAEEEFSSRTGVIVVDTNVPGFTECPNLLLRSKTVVVFDHHRRGEESIENAVLSYTEPYASSTCEMIAEVLQYFDEDIKLSEREADALYAGILIDTNNFVTKTGVRTFEAAAYLRRCGAEVTRVRKMLRNDMAAYKARAEAIRRARVYRGVFAVSVCPAEDIESPTVACAQAANELLNIEGIRASFVLTEHNEKIYVSARSIDDINVQLIMERLGGGGHINSAGTQLEGHSIKEALQIIENTLDEMIEKEEIGT